MKAIMTRTGAFLLLKAPPLSIRTRIAINGGFKNYRYGMKEYLPLYQAILGQKENPNSLYQAASQAIPDNFNEITDTYPTFQTPFLILWGSNDTFISRYHAENMLMDFQDARLEIIPNTSHNPHEENPEKVYDLIKSFYGDNS
jgi:pimeloyl-ACP methyl ester carboxylesterase